MRRRLALLASALVLAGAADAGANGRFPAAQRLVQNPANPDQRYLAATFGLLASGDAGRSWYYVCERAFAGAVVEGDALLEVLPSGVVLAGIVESLGASSDCGCSFRPISAVGADEVVADVTRTDGGAVFSLVRTSAGGAPARFRVDRSDDAGESWVSLSELPSTIAEALTVDVAPSDASRIYVSASNRAGTASLFVSEDGGEIWAERAIPGASTTRQPYIAAVDRTNAEALYVRTDEWEENDEGLEQANDALLYSPDAGVSWTEVLRRGGKLFGLALAPDGSTVFAGYGDPVQAVRVTLTPELGIYRASTSDFAFEHVLTAPVSCLAWTAGKLEACFEENHTELDVDFTVGSADPAALAAPVSLDAFTPLLRLRDVRGPLGCVAEACGDDWTTGNELAPAACLRLGADCVADATSNDIACSAPGGAGGAGGGGTSGAPTGGASTGGAPASGNGGGAGSAVSGAGGGAATGGGGPEESSSGCGCRMPGRGLPHSKILFGVALLAIWAVRRARVTKT